MTLRRGFVLFGVALMAVAGCGSTPGRPTAAAAHAQLRLRPVLTTKPPRTGGTQASAAQRQSHDSATQQDVLADLSCPKGTDPLRDKDDPQLPLITCAREGSAAYLLGPVFLDGAAVRSAVAQQDPSGTGWVINLSFTAAGAKTWAQFTAANVGKSVAVTVDTAVVSAPEIQEAITGGTTEIAGHFSRQQAQDLATSLGG